MGVWLARIVNDKSGVECVANGVCRGRSKLPLLSFCALYGATEAGGEV